MGSLFDVICRVSVDVLHAIITVIAITIICAIGICLILPAWLFSILHAIYMILVFGHDVYYKVMKNELERNK